MKGVSVIICCYNSCIKLPQTLHYLKGQEVKDIDWEILIVDNGSTDKTFEVASEYTSEFEYLNLSYKIIHEPLAGLSNARKKGIIDAKYEYLIFCDDDNWLSNHYVQNVFNLFETDTADIIGGYNSPIFEINPGNWINPYIEAYACAKESKPAGYVDFVFGAGMAIRKSKIKRFYNLQFDLLLTGRKGKSITSGEDSEICLLIKLAKGKILYHPTLTLKHYIFKERLTWTYCKKLLTSFGKSEVVLNLYSEALKDAHKYKLPWSYWIKNFIYYLLLLLKYYFLYKKNRDTVGHPFTPRYLSWKFKMLEYWSFKFHLNMYYKKIIQLELALSDPKDTNQ